MGPEIAQICAKKNDTFDSENTAEIALVWRNKRGIEYFLRCAVKQERFFFFFQWRSFIRFVLVRVIVLYCVRNYNRDLVGIVKCLVLVSTNRKINDDFKNQFSTKYAVENFFHT